MSTGEPTEAGGTAFYDAVYGNFGGQLAATIRAEAFDEDIGQNSWLTAGEHRKFCGWLDLGPSSEVLELASGSGGPALFMVRETGCSVIGIELHQAGVAAANDAACQRGLADRAWFISGDAREWRMSAPTWRWCPPRGGEHALVMRPSSTSSRGRKPEPTTISICVSSSFSRASGD
jgi:hypothetical protein